MKITTKLALLTAALAFGAAPALAVGPPSGTPGAGNPGTSHMPTNPGSQGNHGDGKGKGKSHKPATPGPHASLPAKAKAYGRFCQDESKTHVAGTPGTPFSQCVTAMAKLANGSATNPRVACKDESRKHVAGQPGTPFSRCVSGGKKLLKDQENSDS